MGIGEDGMFPRRGAIVTSGRKVDDKAVRCQKDTDGALVFVSPHFNLDESDLTENSLEGQTGLFSATVGGLLTVSNAGATHVSVEDIEMPGWFRGRAERAKCLVDS
jgi:hypothetical protein